MADYSDNFNRSDVNPIVSPWTRQNHSGGDAQIVSNAVKGVTNYKSAIYYYNNTFTDDQYSWLTYTTVSSNEWTGVILRAASLATSTLMRVSAFGNTYRLYKIISGTETQIGSAYSKTRANGDLIKAWVVGTTYYASFNGVEETPITDSSIASGYAGFCVGAPSHIVDDWQGGDGTGPAPAGHPTALRWGGVPYMTLGRRKW